MRPHAAVRSIIGALFAMSLCGTMAAAQAESGDHGTLTVTGFGQASVPAETAVVRLGVGMESYGPPQPLDPDATPGAEERAQVEPILRTLADVGVPDEDITTILKPYLNDSFGFSGGPPVALIQVTLDSADPERITEVVDAAVVGAAQKRLIVGQVSVAYGVSDCAAVQHAARDAAIADAREQAAAQADLLEVGLGDLHSASDVTYGLESLVAIGGPGMEGACGPFDAGRFVPFYSLPPFDPSADPIVTVYAQMEMTFEISREAAATPAA